MGKFTTRSQLEFINLTEGVIRIYGEDGDDYDWDNADTGKELRPDRNFRDVDIGPFQRAIRDCETSNAAGTSTILMKITNLTGEHKDGYARFSGDQKNAFDSGKGRFVNVKLELSTSIPPGFLIYQVAHNAVNRFIVAPSAFLTNWMSRVEGSRDLFELIIPGTHGSAALTDAGGTESTWTQDSSISKITDQLLGGIRALDLKFELDEKGEIISEHGAEDVKYPPKRIIDEIFEFLSSHTTECVFARIRGNAEIVPKLWEAIISSASGDGRRLVYGARQQFDADPKFRNYVENVWPVNLDDCRGKLLIQTEGGVKDFFGGLQSPGWADNTNDQIISSGRGEGVESVIRKIRVQDTHSFIAGTRAKKWEKITDMLRHQETSDKYSKWYYSFLNASGKHNPKYWAKGSGDDWGMNRRLMNYWAENTYYTSGIIWLDFYREPEGLNALPTIMAAMNSEANKHSVR
ncbi:hypothetical protein ABW20_dc0106775 [Dactylellina cionopaga]|nr:hypothetical protein ABW20_dc0106775 [Dactylellina cionopaga]